MKVGLFDSGVGGLTVLKAIRREFKNLDLIYLGDTARVPYGNKSRETVIRYSLECVNFLISKGVDMVIVACNTASSYALEVLRKTYKGVEFLGVVEPGVSLAKKLSKGRVGVIGTYATIRSGAYQRKLGRLCTFERACPLFVPLVEEGILEGRIVEEAVRLYLSPAKGKIDTLILGCTHYPLLKKPISEFLKGVRVVDSAEATSQYLKGLIRDEGEGKTQIYFTDLYQNLSFLLKEVLRIEEEPQLLELEEVPLNGGEGA